MIAILLAGDLLQSIHDKYYQEIIKALVHARNECGMPQAEVARIWGRKQSIIAKIETCERRIDIIEFIILANIVRLDISMVVDNINKAMKNGI